MPSKKNPETPAATNGAADVPIGSDAPPAGTPVDDGVRTAPYTAKWITIRDASNLANVTAQTVRNAYRDHESFNTPASGDTPAIQHWYVTKMKDEHGNVTDYDAVYLDKSAVDNWVAARAAKPVSSAHGGAKRRIVRLTDDQINAQPKMTLADGTEVAAVVLVDGTMVPLEVPPMGNKKKADDGNGTAPASAEVSAPAVDDTTPVQAQTDLFDVDLVGA